MQVVLRLEDQGKAPSTIVHQKPRCHYDDWAYFLHEKEPKAAVELARCLRWLKSGSAHVVAREEEGGEGNSICVTEALVQRRFADLRGEVGVLRCVVAKVA